MAKLESISTGFNTPSRTVVPLTDVVEATQKYRLENGKITTERPAAISVTSIDGTTVVSSPSADAIDITGIAHGFYILTIDGHSSKIRL